MRLTERAVKLRMKLMSDVMGLNVTSVLAVQLDEEIVNVLKAVRDEALAAARERLKGMADLEIGRMILELEE